ncbi:hypothetical protein BDY19DRAFT_908535 [Irpex rosettiformis]|uniref:Uncharacterized protein n=1 Tax=Irpex rosettiformis TaxID=378272 RepID=A0ACB8TVN7_9APHY|nr:hypothetical protein BDY19DRAFT_908535 [Irpex rosettiformis]
MATHGAPFLISTLHAHTPHASFLTLLLNAAVDEPMGRPHKRHTPPGTFTRCTESTKPPHNSLLGTTSLGTMAQTTPNMKPLAPQSPITIPEILTLVFSHCLYDKNLQSVARAARVCKLWSEVALDVLWRVVTDKFRRPPRQTDWTRFERYARRVRVVKFDDRRASVRRKVLDESVYDDIAATRRSSSNSALLPNLQTLSWVMSDQTRQRRSLVFMHSGIQHLVIQLNVSSSSPSSSSSSPSSSSLASYVEDIISHSPGISTLQIHSPHPIRTIQPETQTLIRGLLYLKHLTLPMYFLTSHLAATLAGCVFLESVEFAEPVERGVGDRRDISHFAPHAHPLLSSSDNKTTSTHLEEESFQSLRRLSIAAYIPHATAFLASRLLPPHTLTSLRLVVLATSPPHVLEELFETLRKFTELSEVVVDFPITPDSPISLPPPFSSFSSSSPTHPSSSRPTISTLRPLLNRPLKKLELRWDYELLLTDDDAHELARGLRGVEVLHLHSEAIPLSYFSSSSSSLSFPTSFSSSSTPTPSSYESATHRHRHRPSLTLRALEPFARYCPRLRYLGLYLDGDSSSSTSFTTTTSSPTTTSSTPTPTTTIPTPTFHQLQELALGSSPLTSTSSATLYLSRVVRAGCVVRAGVRWPDAYGVVLDGMGRGGGVNLDPNLEELGGLNLGGPNLGGLNGNLGGQNLEGQNLGGQNPNLNMEIIQRGTADSEQIRVDMQKWWIGWGEVGRVVGLVVRAREDERSVISSRESRKREKEREEELNRMKKRVEELEREVRVLRGGGGPEECRKLVFILSLGLTGTV